MIDASVLISGVLLIFIELAYLFIARKFNIVDRPNDRTLHDLPTIRGGGIIFYFAVLIYIIFNGNAGPWFLVGLTLVSIVGFMDDIVSLPNLVRLLIHILAFGLLFYETNFLPGGILIGIFAWIIVVGALNAFNFMDGINGITGGYSLLAIASLLVVNVFYVTFTDLNFLLTIAIALLVFIYFNFRKRAICFAGDVGSTSIAFIIIYLILLLSIKTGNFIFLWFLALYGVDTSLTIIRRLIRKENIFKAHRLHLFQVMVYHYKLSHIQVSLIYVGVQSVISLFVILNLNQGQTWQYASGVLIIVILAIIHIFMIRRASRPLPQMETHKH